MAGQSPALPDGATPVPVHGILTVDYLKLNHPGFGLQLHRPTALMYHRASAQGEKRRPAGRRLPASVAEVFGASTHGLRPSLPFRSRAMSGAAQALCSSVSFGYGFSFDRMRNLSQPLLNHTLGGSVKMRPSVRYLEPLLSSTIAHT